MGFFSNLLSTAAPVVGGLLGGAPGAAIGGLAGGLLGGSPYKFTVPDISGRYNELSPQIQAIISQLQQGGLDTRPYDAMRKNNELGAFNTAKRMNEVLNQNLSARGLSNSSIRTSGNQGIYAKALADMATRMAQIDAQQAQAENADRLQRSGMSLSAIQNLLRSGTNLDANAGKLALSAQGMNYGAEGDYSNLLSSLGAFAGQSGWLDKLRQLLGGGGGGGSADTSSLFNISDWMRRLLSGSPGLTTQYSFGGGTP